MNMSAIPKMHKAMTLEKQKRREKRQICGCNAFTIRYMEFNFLILESSLTVKYRIDANTFVALY